ncbi:MAG: VanZ family protein [Bacilli bacterium]|nr:VanZ family protein [Bacilli bacterium]
MKKKIISYIFYAIAGFILLVYGISELNPNLIISASERLILLCSSCVFLYFGGFLLSKHLNNEKPMKANLWIFFILYIVLLITLTLFDEEFSRYWQLIFMATKEEINNYFTSQVNLIPFNTIIGYIKNYNELLDSSIVIINIYGNFIACMPFAFFLPMLFKKQSKFKNYLITMILIIFGIEVVQLLTLSGSFDIDDFILNISGALIMYGIMKIQSVQNLLKNIFLLSKIKINKKTIVKVITFSFIGLIASLLLVQQVAKHYYYNYEEHNRIHNPDITFEYSNVCSDNNLFYESKIYKYYFECYDVNDFYVIVNEKEKYTIKDFVDNSDYIYDIERVAQRLDYYNVEYYIKHKYSYYEMEVEINNRTYSVSNNYENEYVKIIVNKLESEDNNIDIFEVNFIPLKVGNTIVEFEFCIYDEEGNEVEIITKKIEIKVKDDFSVDYKEI